MDDDSLLGLGDVRAASPRAAGVAPEERKSS